MPNTTQEPATLTLPETVEVVEDPEPEAIGICANCEDDIYEDDDTHDVIIGRRGGGHQYLYATWCTHCRDHSTHCVDGYSDPVSEDYASNFLYYWESDGEYHEDPEENEDEDGEILYSYGTDVLTIHGWPNRTPKDSLCFGVELEMESRERAKFVQMVDLLGGREGNGRYILKSDGSLEEGQGAELVTLPYTLEAHRKAFGWDTVLSDKLRSLAMSGRGTTSCGIHIHVNRSALSALTIGKLLVFLNSPANDSFVTCVAQRASSSMCERDESKAKITGVRNPDACRYDILNVNNYKTIEFRMFRGNLRPERVLKNLEFCHSLILYCQQSSIADAEELQKYLAWLERNAKAYPHLVAFLIEKGRITKPHERSTAPYAMLAAQAARVEA